MIESSDTIKMLEDNINNIYLESPIGTLKIEGDQESIIGISFIYKIKKEDPNEIVLACKRQFIEYFNKQRKDFTIPINPDGNRFQQAVWQSVKGIPFGQTVSSSDISIELGNVNKARAVGMANSKNPVLIIIPCHRVIGADGSLTGYGGGIERKKWLLNHEKKFVQLSLFY